jgi:hypothetical protein
MTTLEQHRETSTPGGRLVVRIALASVAALTLAGGLMWWRFGPAIFMDVLTTLQGCF